MTRGWMLLAGLFGLSTATAGPALAPCHAPNLPDQVLCGTYDVPAGAMDETSMELAVTVIPARPDRRSEDAVLILAGGPGQGARDVVGMVGRLLSETGHRRDLVFVDQRGTGESMPLDCPDPPAEVSVEAHRAWAAQCLEKLDFASGRFAPDDFSTLRTIEDLESLRLASGYRQWNLFGGSYGTRVGQLYMREHPDAIRSAVLDAVAPIGMIVGATMGADAQPLLDGLFERCEAQAGCRAAFPELETRFNALLESLSNEPVMVQFDHPSTGQPMDRELNRDSLVTLLRGLLYTPAMHRTLPSLLHQAAGGDSRPLMALGEYFGERYGEQMAFGLTATVLCSEDIGRHGRAAVPAAEFESFVGSAQIDYWFTVCEDWPRYAVPEDFDTPLASDIPTLLVSGELDPVTPPRYGETVLAGLDNARHLVVPGGGHTVAFAGGSCMRSILNDFFDDPRPQALDTECLARQQAAPLFTHMTGYLSSDESNHHD
jgi:pimeloyl-ACP methyl ester carboxylesterase